MERLLIVQTAFPGDVILTLPLVQALREHYPSSRIDCMVVPRCAELLHNHPAVSDVLSYDKRGDDRGMSGLIGLANRLRRTGYDTAVVPHRSLRSAVLVRLSAIPNRIGFSTSSGRFLFSHVVKYRPDLHEIDRNLRLLLPLGIDIREHLLPTLHPDVTDRTEVDAFLSGMHYTPGEPLIGIAPGTVWSTKRWPEERYTRLVAILGGKGLRAVLIGGPEDRVLCERIAHAGGSTLCHTAAGRFGLLGSAELIRRCAVMVGNDSAPMHIAVAMRVPVVAVYGATVPAFGFAPRGPRDVVAEITDLRCRPCSIHGGDRCPIGTFDCMRRISAEHVFGLVTNILKPS